MKTIAWLLVAVLTLNGTRSASQTSALAAASETRADATTQATMAKAEVQRRGVGEKSRVRVRLSDGTQVKGYICAACLR
jgi:membrane protein required for beta-lactamase induction